MCMINCVWIPAYLAYAVRYSFSKATVFSFMCWNKNEMIYSWYALINLHLNIDIMMTPSKGNIYALLALCEDNSPVTGEFLSQRPVTRSFDVFFDLRLNKQMNKQSRRRWFETPWRSCCVTVVRIAFLRVYDPMFQYMYAGFPGVLLSWHMTKYGAMSPINNIFY